ncbi:MAG: VWA domain-containing protein [Myxococcales bacterium]|nr:VWA domain-containing protein [Myxococcales bacterium]
MKKIASLVSATALLAAGAAVVPACSSANRTGPGNGNGQPDATAEAGDPGIFEDAGNTTKKDAFNIFEAACATASAATSTDPVVLEFVLDGSGSMDSDNKWTAAVQALNAVFDDILAKNDPNVVVGMIVYEDQNDTTNGSGPYPGSNDVYPQVVTASHHKKLVDRINLTNASGGTPTFLALSGGYSVLLNYKEVPPAAPADLSRKVVILMSDGVPNGGSTEQAQCVTAAKDSLSIPAPKGPIKTFSVGIGPFPGSAFSYDPKFMGDVAVAGGTRASPQCNPAATNIANVCHFQVTPNGKPINQLKQEFINAINRIRGLAVGCEFNIVLNEEAGASSINPDQINVVWTDGNGDQNLIPQDDVDGWSYDDPSNPTKVILNGQSCGDVSSDLGANVQIVIGCPSVIN